MIKFHEIKIKTIIIITIVTIITILAFRILISTNKSIAIGFTEEKEIIYKSPLQDKVNNTNILDAIATVRSNADPDHIDDMGRRGLLGLSEQVWDSSTYLSYRFAFTPEINYSVGEARLLWLDHILEQNIYRRPSLQEILAAWDFENINSFRNINFDPNLAPKETRRFIKLVIYELRLITGED